MANSIAIFGAGSLGKLAHYYATEEMGLKVLCFVVDADYSVSETVRGAPLLTWEQFNSQYLQEKIDVYVAVGYRSMNKRASVYKKVFASGYRLINIVSRSAHIANDVCIGINNFFMPGVVVEPGCEIGSNNVVWSNVTICHDSKLKNHNFLASNATVGGEVSIGDRNFIGFSATIGQQRRIGNDVLIGAQSLLLSDVTNLVHYQGIPARKVEIVDKLRGICFD